LDGTWSGVLCRGSPGRDFFVTGCLHSTKLVSSSGFGGRDRHCTRTDRDLFYSIGFVFTMQVQQGTASMMKATPVTTAHHTTDKALHMWHGDLFLCQRLNLAEGDFSVIRIPPGRVTRPGDSVSTGSLLASFSRLSFEQP
jgi:hypothetical protein